MPNTDTQGQPIPGSLFALPGATCPDCGSTEFEIHDYNMSTHDGDIHCAQCGKFIRIFDAG